MSDLFKTVKHKYYITLYYDNVFKGNYDNDKEVKEAKREILGY